MKYIRIMLFFSIFACLYLYFDFRGNIVSRTVISMVVAFLTTAFLLVVDIRLSRKATKKILIGVLGMLVGFLVARVLSSQIVIPILTSVGYQSYDQFASIMLTIIFSYLGIVVGVGAQRDLRIFYSDIEDVKKSYTYVLDMDCIVDGRIVRLAASPILQGELIIPRFYVDNLENMAAVGPPLERKRAERGRENLRALQEGNGCRVIIREVDFRPGQEGKGIIKFTKDQEATAIFLDQELAKAAEKNDISIVDLNQISSMLKPEVKEGDILVIKLVKAGKEYNQAVGYLEDGNMVVVEDASSEIGRTVRVTVSGITQTKAGTLIFGQLKK